MASNRVLPQKNTLQKVLECPLCLHPVEQPKQMPGCYHIFCELCLEELPSAGEYLTEGLLCPICETFGIPREVGEGSFLADLISIHSSDHNETVRCKQCSVNPQTASVMCHECKFELCEKCKASHLKIPFLKNHHISDLDEACMTVDRLLLCNKHATPLELNCVHCDQLICMTCIFAHHNTHFVEPLVAKEEKLVKSMTTEMCVLSNICSAIEKKILVVRQKIDEIEMSYTNFISALDMHDVKEPAAKERLKDHAMQQQESEIKSLRKIKRHLERQAAKGGHLQAVGEVTLQYGRCTSFVIEIHDGLLRCLQEFIQTRLKDQLNVQINIPRPSDHDRELQKRLPEVKTFPDHVMVSPCGHVFQQTRVDFSYVDIFGMINGQRERICDIQQQFRMSYIEDKLWLPQNKNVQIYDHLGAQDRLIECYRNTRVVRKAPNGHVMLAGDQGLWYKIREEDAAIQITEGSISDVSCCGFETAVFRVKDRTVEIYEFQDKFPPEIREKECQWKIRCTFPVQVSMGHAADTILLTETHVHFSTMRNKRLLKYTKNGVLVQSVNLHTSCLISGTDVDGNFLLCRFSKNGGFRILNSNLELVSEDVLVNEIRYPLDCIIDLDHNVWVLQGCPNEGVEYNISKVT